VKAFGRRTRKRLFSLFILTRRLSRSPKTKVARSSAMQEPWPKLASGYARKPAEDWQNIRRQAAIGESLTNVSAEPGFVLYSVLELPHTSHR
jgi:hypothetical protein